MKAQESKRRNQSKNRGLIFVVSGPSGSGKTTLRDELLKDGVLRKRLEKSVSFTTRPKRSGERDGREYFFITREKFLRNLEAKKILEWTKYLGYYYATSKEFVERVLKRNKSILLCLDLKGAFKIKQLYPNNTVTIFIAPPSLAALRGRIEARCNRTGREEIAKRLKLARRELLAAPRYDYCVANKNLHRAAKELKEIILKEAAFN